VNGDVTGARRKDARFPYHCEPQAKQSPAHCAPQPVRTWKEIASPAARNDSNIPAGHGGVEIVVAKRRDNRLWWPKFNPDAREACMNYLVLLAVPEIPTRIMRGLAG
jgi:hypothetical protein